jgi:hypothetical protein
MPTYSRVKPEPTRLNRTAFQVAAFAENRWVIFTQKFILVIVGVIVAVDLFLALNDVKGDTISEVIKGWAYRRFFVLSWAWGVLAGHLFLTRNAAVIATPWNIWLLLGLSVLLVAVGIGYKGMVGVPIQAALLVLGVAAGYLLWPQAPIGAGASFTPSPEGLQNLHP